MAAVDVRSSVDLLLSLELERRCAKPLFFLRALELDFFAEADVAQHVAHQDLAVVPLRAHEELAEVSDLVLAVGDRHIIGFCRVKGRPSESGRRGLASGERSGRCLFRQ
jgi:hypothetical protein